MFTPYTFSGTRVIDAQGRVLVYTDSDAAANGADERINVFADGAHVGTIRPGAMVKMDREANRWELVPVSASLLLSGTVHIGNGDFHPGTINGTVTVIDGELQRSIQGFQGLGMIHRQAAVNYSAVALCVYTAGLSVAVRSLQLDAGTTQNARLWTAQVSGEPTYTERRAIRNKLVNLAPVSFELTGGGMYALTDSTTTAAAAPDSDPTKFSNWTDWGAVRLLNSTGRVVMNGAPIIIPGGYALVAVHGAAASQLSMIAEVEVIYS